jgi:4'-phosphopantetheinyl transferase
MSKKEKGSEAPSAPSVGSDETGLASASTLIERPLLEVDSVREMSEVVTWKLAQPVVVWFRPTQSMSAQAVDQAWSILSLDERARAERFVFERDRRDFVAAHALLRGALSRHGGLSHDGWKFESEAAGKPYLVQQSGLQFNIAHTRGLVACALSLAGPIGIDVECIDGEREIDSISENYFAPSEVAELRACEEGTPRQARFIELWTLKEAYLKALGAGLGRPLDEIAFHFAGASGLHVTAQGSSGHAGWRFGLFAPLDNYRLAVAVRTNTNFGFVAEQWPAERNQPSHVPLRSSALTAPAR